MIISESKRRLIPSSVTVSDTNRNAKAVNVYGLFFDIPYRSHNWII